MSTRELCKSVLCLIVFGGLPSLALAQPANDDCANAEVITALPALVSGDTTLAQPEAPGFCGTGQGSGGVWYELTGTGNEIVATTCDGAAIPGGATFDTKIRVYTDCLGTCVVGNDDSCIGGSSGLLSTVSWQSLPGQTYLVFMFGFGTSIGQFQLSIYQILPGACCFVDGSCQDLSPNGCVAAGGSFQGGGTDCATSACVDTSGACCYIDGTCDDTVDSAGCVVTGGTFQGVGMTCGDVVCADQTPPNDSCATAENIPSLPVLISGDTTLASPPNAAPCFANNGSAGGLWYRVVGTGGEFFATTCDGDSVPGSATFDTQLRVYTDCVGGCVTGNDDSCVGGTSGLRSTVNWSTVTGQEYFIVINGFGGAFGSFELSIYENAPGACCFVDGTCQLLTAAQCFQAGGAFNGSGVDCATIVCEDTSGACCFTSGACDDSLDASGCTSAGGMFNGVGSTCAGVLCVPTTGACCFLNGSCDDTMNEGGCLAAGGEFQGVGVNCGQITCPDLLNGPDVIYSDVTSITNWGAVGGIRGYSLGSHTCNIGDENLQWGNSWNGTPILAMNAYRLNNGRLEQIGLSWCKHACCAAAGSGCGVACNGVGGSFLGQGCRDVYGSGYNGGQGLLGPRSTVNAYTGDLISAPGGFGNAIERRLQVHEADLALVSSGAAYFVEGVYVGTDDAQAQNWLNNASYKSVTVNASTFDLTPIGAMIQQVPAIFAWRDHGNGPGQADPSVVLANMDVVNEGRFVVGARVSDNGDGTWRYEYAVFNLNSDRSGGSFHVPVSGATVTNVGFHDVDHHSGEPFDNTDWSPTISAADVAWSSPQTYADNPNSNALRWGTMYNFWFDADAPPADGTVTLALFTPSTGNPDDVTATLPVPAGCACEIDGSGQTDVSDLLLYLSRWFVNDPAADIDGDPGVGVTDLLVFLQCWFPASEGTCQ